MKITIDLPHIFRLYYEAMPKFSYADIWHFETNGDGWLYFTVSGWAVGFRARTTCITDPANTVINFSLRASDFMNDIPMFTDPVTWEVNVALGYVFNSGVGHCKMCTYPIIKAPSGKFLPQGDPQYDLDLEAIYTALSADPGEVITVTGGQVYVNNPMSPTSPIYRINHHNDVEDFSTSSTLVRLAQGFPYESPVAVTPTHVVVHEKETGCYTYTERYVESPYYTSKALLYGLLTSGKGQEGIEVPSAFYEALRDDVDAGLVLVLATDGHFTVSGYTERLVLVDLPYDGPDFKAFVNAVDLYRASKICGEQGVKMMRSTEGDRTALLMRSTEGAALLPIYEGKN